MTCPHTTTLGVYLLGALEPTERSAFESHLSYCDICRGELVRLAPLPGLLNQVTPEDFADGLPPTGAEGTPIAVATQVQPVTEPVPIPVQLPPPPGYDEPVERDTRQAPDPRGRRYWQVAAAAAVVVLLAVGGVFGWRALREPPAQPRAEGVTWSVTAADGSASAQARMVDHTWGTEIYSAVQGLPPGKECYLVVYDHYGNRQVAGWWGTDHDPDEEIPGSVSFPRRKISRMEYKLDEDTVVLTIQAPPHR